jgi:hypothetical protein
MVYYKTKIPIWAVLGGGGLHRKLLVYFMAIWSISRLLVILSAILVYFTVNWYIFPPFGTYVVLRLIWQPWLQPRRPEYFFNAYKDAQNVAQPIFVKYNTSTFL